MRHQQGREGGVVKRSQQAGMRHESTYTTTNNSSSSSKWWMDGVSGVEWTLFSSLPFPSLHFPSLFLSLHQPAPLIPSQVSRLPILLLLGLHFFPRLFSQFSSPISHFPSLSILLPRYWRNACCTLRKKVIVIFSFHTTTLLSALFGLVAYYSKHREQLSYYSWRNSGLMDCEISIKSERDFIWLTLLEKTRCTWLKCDSPVSGRPEVKSYVQSWMYLG